MRKIMGIDYGKRRVGIALSDETRSLAFPREVISNNKKLLSSILKISREENVRKIVIGESLDYKGQENKIMSGIKTLKKNLEEAGFSVYLEPEFLTSREAERIQGKKETLDASAAAVILRSHLERIKNGQT